MSYEPRDREIYEALRELANVEMEGVSIRPPTRSSRAAIAGVETDDRGSDTVVIVRLRLGSRNVVGTARGPATVPAICRTAAEATLLAIQQIIRSGDARIRIDWLDIYEPDPQQPRVVHTAVVFRTADREDLLVGSAIIRGVEYEAAVRATLDALNRQVELLVRPADEID